MRQRGFIFPALSPTLWIAIGAAVLIAGLSIAVKVQSARLGSEKEAHATTKAAYQTFKAGVELLGKQAEAKAAAEIERQKQVSKERSAGYEKRLASINAAYRRLRDNRVDPGGGAVSAIPDASIRAADPASDNRLLEALRAADEQTARLIELQQWVNEQGKVTP